MTPFQSAVCSAVEMFIDSGLPFSPGEVVNDIREHKPNLVFCVQDVTKLLRTMFLDGEFPAYGNAVGQDFEPVRVRRTTKGRFRTPGGILVDVYGPNESACLAHDFEVHVLRPKPAVSKSVT